MVLRTLEMQGFKSFPDKTVLNFGKGITAVVGPNGSGKSNISDAVRWVLGETSTKSLRGSKMEDVIFGGTSARKALGFAQVQLTLDNSDGTLKDRGEIVTVTRRYYRSGESEYKIDGEQVRRKDIRELFMDTGLGADGYSLVGQGKIDSIISAKNEDRRELFEEAAGISRFRHKRTDAQRRLEQAQENLVRLLDILGELESRVGPLKVQSEKAAAFLDLSAEKKELEIGGTAQAAAAVLPENADNKEVTWTSSNESAVTVNESGLIKAIGVGSADIIATAKDGSGVTGKVTITVKSKDIDPIPTPTPAPAEKVEELNKAVKEAESFKEADYTAESAGKLKAALAEAKKVLENKNATEAEVNAALKAVSDAKAALVKKDDNNNNNGNNNPAPKVPAVGTTTTVKGVTYKVTKADAVNGTVSAVKLKATKKTKVTIQDTVKVGNYSFKVTTIGKNAFKNNKKLKSIVIGSNVKSIGSNAFSKASKLSSVTFKGTKIVKVGRNAFKGTSSKMKVTVPKKMKSKTLRALKKNLQKAKISKKATYNKVAKVK